MMRLQIAVDQQGGSVRRNLAQKAALNEETEIVVNGCERDSWNAAADRGINVFRRIVSVSSDNSFIDDLTLMRDRQTVLGGQLAELPMRELHNYWMRIIIKLRAAAVSTTREV
jgi:hypothetical protein